MKKINRASKYLLYVIAVLIAFNVCLAYFLTKQSSEAMRSLINSRMLDVSNTAAGMLNGDELEQLTADDYDTPEYQRALQMLTYFQDRIELEYIYCIKDLGNKNFVFSIDPTVEDPGQFGDPIVYTEALYKASIGVPSVDDKPYQDEWGRFYSAYTPVFDSKHEVAGIVAVDFSAAWYENQIRRLVRTTCLIIGAAVLFSIAIAAMVAVQYRRSMEHVFEEMNDLSEGIETLIQEVLPENPDENNKQSKKEDFGQNGFNDEVTMLGTRIRLMQDRLEDQISTIRSRAYIDGLTGLNNRSSYEDDVKLLEQRIAEDQKIYYSVVVFDINQLKIINDDYGHEKGDHVIVQVGKAIKQAMDGEKLYRIGGDEFVAIVKGMDPSDKITALRSLIDEINEKDTELKETSLEVAVSIGYAVYDSDTDLDYADVFKKADDAMYADKRAYYQTHEDRRKKRTK